MSNELLIFCLSLNVEVSNFLGGNLQNMTSDQNQQNILVL